MLSLARSDDYVLAGQQNPIAGGEVVAASFASLISGRYRVPRHELERQGPQSEEVLIGRADGVASHHRRSARRLLNSIVDVETGCAFDVRGRVCLDRMPPKLCEQCVVR
jgi:hypothetical protein